MNALVLMYAFAVLVLLGVGVGGGGVCVFCCSSFSLSCFILALCHVDIGVCIYSTCAFDF